MQSGKDWMTRIQMIHDTKRLDHPFQGFGIISFSVVILFADLLSFQLIEI